MAAEVHLYFHLIWSDQTIQQNREKPQTSVTESATATAIQRGRCTGVSEITNTT